MKKILFAQRGDTPHMVGDFPVRSIFSYHDIAKEISPFLLMDYMGPAEFPPSHSSERKGVDAHPHRGFETVTIMFSGEVEHRDSSGGGGVIKSGDVQWMTAGSGVVHEEFQGLEMSEEGGTFHGIQIWVNLPKKDKMTKPKYQGIKKESIPVVNLSDGVGSLRVIAGEFQGTMGPASTYSPINLWDISIKASSHVELKVPQGHTGAIFVASGSVSISGSDDIQEAVIAVLEKDGDTFSIKTKTDSRILFLGGEPLNEPIVGYGPFVMNSQFEIAQAMKDFEQGKMGVLEKLEGSE